MGFMVPARAGVTERAGVRSERRSVPEEAGMGETDPMEELEARASHHHEAAVHDHKHFHVTHYLHKGENWAHLLSTHVHEHNHPELEHVHIPHEDVEKEHKREGHIHDHARPADSPA
jgi:hypothetical protein